MIFSTFKEFKKNYKKKNFSQIYAIKNKPKLETIEKLVELVSLNKDSFIFESVEKVKIRGRYTIFGFNPDLVIETKNNCIIQNINNKKVIIKIVVMLDPFPRQYNFFIPFYPSQLKGLAITTRPYPSSHHLPIISIALSNNRVDIPAIIIRKTEWDIMFEN